jgi:hypothetical protein
MRRRTAAGDAEIIRTLNIRVGLKRPAGRIDPRRQVWVIFSGRDTPLPTAGLPSKAERLALTERFDGLPSDSFRTDQMQATAAERTAWFCSV